MVDHMLGLESFAETLQALAGRARDLRLLQNWTQQELARRSGVGVATLHRFEKTGQVSFENALRIATALGVEAGFGRLFEAPKYTSLDEVLERSKGPGRRRARKRG
jgi:transcriptional regulator with XRE-family HTH domain